MTSITAKAELGTSVLILPTRNPILFAKQAACVDTISGGRLVLGVGVGWLREEFEALGADFDARGAVLDEWISVARRCWTGTVEPFEGRFYRLAEAIYCRPTPARHVPVLIGGMSRYAQERAGRIADGWLAQYSLDDLSESGIADGLAVLREAGTRAGRQPAELDGFRIVVRVTGADRKLDVLATRLESLAGAGATELVVDVDWDTDEGPAKGFDILRSAVA
jgi:probable F420-dependent oxidoreductase